MLKIKEEINVFSGNNMADIASMKYKNVTWVCKELIARINSDRGLSKYKGFTRTPRFADALDDMITKYINELDDNARRPVSDEALLPLVRAFADFNIAVTFYCREDKLRLYHYWRCCLVLINQIVKSSSVYSFAIIGHDISVQSVAGKSTPICRRFNYLLPVQSYANIRL